MEVEPIIVNRAVDLVAGSTNFIELYSPATGHNGYVVDFLATVQITSSAQLPEFTPGDAYETNSQAEYRYYQLTKDHPCKYLGIYVSLPGSNQRILRSRLKMWNSWPPYQQNLLSEITSTENFLLEPGAKLWLKIDEAPGGSILWLDDRISVWLVAGELPLEETSDEISAGTPYSAAVTTSSSVVLAANPDRKLVTIVNRGNAIAYLNFGSTAVAGAGISLNPGGSSYVLNNREINYKGAISAITSSGNTTLEIMEAV